MQKQMMQEVEAKQPVYVAFVDVSESWLYGPDPLKLLPLTLG